MSDFSDRQFVAGSLIGTRTWRIDKFGRLTGVTKAQAVWKPGTNEAQCLWEDDPFSVSYQTVIQQIQQMQTSLSGFGRGGFVPAHALPNFDERRRPHSPGSKCCECGFYAYFIEAANPYHLSSNQTHGVIEGIVEGYGVATVGTKGFRSERARILALITPVEEMSAPIDWARNLYPDVQIFGNRTEAFKAFPLTVPAPLRTPETDPEFWDRKAEHS